MPYIGKQPANVPVTADDIPNDSITAAKIVDAAITIDDIGPNAVGNSEMADDAIGLNELSATLEDKEPGKSAGDSKLWDKVRADLDYFRQHNAEAYMVLLD